MNELVVISGKGGTGKTSLVASFAALAERAVLADCDVDAADLHLVVEPTVVRRHSFSGGKQARIRPERCAACGRCVELCRFGAVRLDPGDGSVGRACRVDPVACEGCGVCAWFCPAGAVEFGPVVTGEWFVSQTRFGPMVHAKLGVAAENSGKLVTTVRTAARELAQHEGRPLVIIDGSPGIGCPVIASITGASLVLIVTEPTLSGRHDLERVAELANHFAIPAMVCVNKWDINPQIAEEIEAVARRRKMALAGRVRYDRSVTRAQIERRAIVQEAGCPSAGDIRELWGRIVAALGGTGGAGAAGQSP